MVVGVVVGVGVVGGVGGGGVTSWERGGDGTRSRVTLLLRIPRYADILGPTSRHPLYHLLPQS